MKSLINFCCSLLFLMLLVLLVFPFSAKATECLAGEQPSLRFPYGTTEIYAACFDGCRAVQGWQGTSTWFCDLSKDYCSGYFELSGATCTGSEDTDGYCDGVGECIPDQDPTPPDLDNPDIPNTLDITYTPYTGSNHEFAARHVASELDVLNPVARMVKDALKRTYDIQKKVHEQGSLNSKVVVDVAVTADKVHQIYNDTRNLVTIGNDVSTTKGNLEALINDERSRNIALNDHVDNAFEEQTKELVEYFDVADNKTRGLFEDLDEIKDAISDNNDDIRNVADYVDDVDSMVYDIRRNTGQLSSQVGTMSGKLSGVEGKLSQATAQNTEIMSRVGDNKTALTDLSSDISDLSDDIQALSSAVGTGSGSDGGSSGGNGDGDGSVDLTGIANKLNTIINPGRTFTEPTETPFEGDLFKDDIETLEAEITELTTEINTKLSESPINLGTMAFASGSYSGSSFDVVRGGQRITIGFNLFDALGPNLNLIKTVILLVAALISVTIILTSGRKS